MKAIQITIQRREFGDVRTGETSWQTTAEIKVGRKAIGMVHPEFGYVPLMPVAPWEPPKGAVDHILCLLHALTP